MAAKVIQGNECLVRHYALSKLIPFPHKSGHLGTRLMGFNTQLSSAIVEDANFHHGAVDSADVLEDLRPIWGSQVCGGFQTCDYI